MAPERIIPVSSLIPMDQCTDRTARLRNFWLSHIMQ